MYYMLPDEIVALILVHLPWEEDADKLLKEYPFAKQQWKMYTNFRTIVSGGHTTHLVNNQLHCDDGPAIVCNIGNHLYHEYYYAGILHRIDGPARIIWNNSKITHVEYYYMGHVHRINGPAMISATSWDTDSCHIGELFHNFDKPPIKNIGLSSSYHYYYYIHGYLHRIDGPAVVRYMPGERLMYEYYYNGHFYSSLENMQKFLKKN
jgi:hypothetical protein